MELHLFVWRIKWEVRIPIGDFECVVEEYVSFPLVVVWVIYSKELTRMSSGCVVRVNTKHRPRIRITKSTLHFIWHPLKLHWTSFIRDLLRSPSLTVLPLYYRHARAFEISRQEFPCSALPQQGKSGWLLLFFFLLLFPCQVQSRGILGGNFQMRAHDGNKAAGP